MARTLNNEVDVLNIASLDNDIKDSFTRAMITEDVNTTSAASKAYAKGEYFIHTDRYLYKALTDIVVGETITPDVNAEVVTVSEELVRLFAQSPEGIFEILSNVENTSVASKNYVKGSQFIWTDKKLYEATADIVSGSTFVVGTNIKLADNLTSQIQTLTNNDDAMLNILGAKNLLPITGTSQTVNGVTFTVNSDGSVTVNGTASDSAYVIYYTTDVASQYPLKAGEAYIVSGHPDGLSDASRIQIEMNGSTIATSKLNDGLFTAPAFNNKLNVYIRIQSGETLNNETFYPMLRLASVGDGTYVPYAMTNRELTLQSIVEAETLNDSHFYSPATIKKCGRVVSLNLYGFKDLVDRTNNTIYGIIPYEYRPSSTVFMTTLGASPSATSTVETYKISIDVSGNIRIYPYNGVARQANADVTLTYII